MLIVLAMLGFLALACGVAFTVGMLLYRHELRNVERSAEQKPLTLGKAHSLYHRLLARAVDGPEEDRP